MIRPQLEGTTGYDDRYKHMSVTLIVPVDTATLPRSDTVSKPGAVPDSDHRAGSSFDLNFSGIEIDPMTYCVGVILDEGMILASRLRTNAGVDNYAKFCKMTVFERAGDRAIILLSSGNLAGTQAVISVLKQRGDARVDAINLWNAKTMFDVAILVADAMRDIERRDGKYLAESAIKFNASFILGGQIRDEPLRLFRIYARAILSRRSPDTPFFQTGETKYGKPILDRMITPSTSLADAAKCVLVSFNSTMRSNLSVGMPIDLICYQRDSLKVDFRRRFDEGDPYFTALGRQWSEGVRQTFSNLPPLQSAR